MLPVQPLPLVHDHHTHVSLYAALADAPRLDGLDKASALEKLRALPGDVLSLILGWNSSRLGLGPADLRGLPPAVIVDLSLHGFRLTPAAEVQLRSAEPELVARHLDDRWRETQLPRILSFFGRLAPLTPAKLEAFLAGLRQVGVGSATDMLLVDAAALDVLRASTHDIEVWADPDTYAGLDPDRRSAVAGLKLFLDGALGPRTAALEGGFLDGGEGLLTYGDADLRDAVAAALAFGKPLSLHAIGGRAIAQALTVLEGHSRDGLRLPSIRLEHVQFITRDQARRARDLGIILSMQPNFNSDSVDYADRLDAQQLAANNPFRMLVDEVGFVPGQDLIFGSDGMPHGIPYALTWSLFPAFAGQRLSLEEWRAGCGPARGGGGELIVEVDSAGREVRLGALTP